MTIDSLSVFATSLCNKELYVSGFSIANTQHPLSEQRVDLVISFSCDFHNLDYYLLLTDEIVPKYFRAAPHPTVL